jgi:glycosyltransferase involved in cell wall biosynthesis
MVPLRVVLVTAYFPPAPGGQELHVFELARGLTELGHDVHVLTSDLLASGRDRSSDYKVTELRAWSLGSDALTFRLGRALRDARPDLIHVHSPLMTISTLASLHARGTPLVATYHGDYHKFSRWGNLLKTLRNHIQLPLVLRNASTVIALTESDRALLASYGVERARIEIVRPGLDLATFSVPSPPVPGGGERILYVGRIVYQKGIKRLITSFGALCEEFDGVELVVAGEGEALGDMRALARDLDLDDRVSFPGWVGHDDLVRLYASATAVVLPSYSEGMPYALLEAMAAGRPVIASDVSGLRELVTHGRNGLLFDLGDGDGLHRAMARMLRDTEGRREMGERGRELVRTRFSKERWLEDTVRVYERAR